MNSEKQFHVAFVGNPNCGKTTLFNAITGSKLKVANWPGVTIEKKEGSSEYEGEKLTLIDTPGIYSLTSYTIEEKVTRSCILDDDIEVIVNVLDASNLERNLYLTLQLLELGKPVVIALNMMDIVRERGMEIDLHRLPELLGDIPVVPVSGTKKQGLDILLHAVVHHKDAETCGDVFPYSNEIEDKIAKVEVVMSAWYPTHSSARWHAIKLLEEDEIVCEEHPINITQITSKSYEKEIIQSKYRYIESIIKETLFYKEKKAAATDKIDRVLTHPFWGVPMFLGIMGIIFFLTFQIGDLLKIGLEQLLNLISVSLTQVMELLGVSQWLVSLLIDGILAGVGGILTFLPNIVILFIALAVMEDSGYMSRVAYVMDKIMGKLGLSGRAFLPMVLGFGCSVPAVMATRALETEKDRRKTMLITPFISCSARLPIYVMISGMFFEKYAGLVSLSMYILGILVALLTAFLVNLFDKGKENESLLIELPEYKRPNLNSITIYVWNKVKDYLTKAGTTIFIASIIIWFALNFGTHGMTTNPKDSFAAILGSLLAPIMIPAGLGMWQIVVALIAGVSAKEVVVSSVTVLFMNASGNSSVISGILSANPSFGASNALALMVFCLLYTPCVATIATIRKESNSLKFTIGSIGYQLGVAWILSTLTYQIARLFF